MLTFFSWLLCITDSLHAQINNVSIRKKDTHAHYNRLEFTPPWLSVATMKLKEWYLPHPVGCMIWITRQFDLEAATLNYFKKHHRLWWLCTKEAPNTFWANVANAQSIFTNMNIAIVPNTWRFIKIISYDLYIADKKMVIVSQTCEISTTIALSDKFISH